MINVTLPPDSAAQWTITTAPAATDEYQHDWLALMPPDALCATAVSIFLDWKRVQAELGCLHPSSDEELDACQKAWDALLDLVGIVRAYDAVYNAAGMNDELYDEFVEVLQ